MHFTVSALEQTDSLAGSFDLVCSFQIHFHWDDLSTVLREIYR
ncbi:methyltransferase domain-containing protein [Streptococcus criceti]